MPHHLSQVVMLLRVVYMFFSCSSVCLTSTENLYKAIQILVPSTPALCGKYLPVSLSFFITPQAWCLNQQNQHPRLINLLVSLRLIQRFPDLVVIAGLLIKLLLNVSVLFILFQNLKASWQSWSNEKPISSKLKRKSTMLFTKKKHFKSQEASRFA